MKPVYHTSNLNRPGMAWRRRPGKGVGPVTQISLATSPHSTELIGQVTAHSSGFYGELVPSTEVGVK